LPRVERQITIAAPRDRVFAFVADHRNALKWMHNFTRFDPVEPGAYGLGAKVDASGLVMGFPIATKLEIVGFDPPRQLVSKTTGRLKSTSTWDFKSEGEGTRVVFTGEYDLPGPLLRMIGGPFVQHELETSAEASLRNLKQNLEGASSG
jgi:carbon monoxide dehydrogenase subunit G